MAAAVEASEAEAEALAAAEVSAVAVDSAAGLADSAADPADTGREAFSGVPAGAGDGVPGAGVTVAAADASAVFL